MQRSKARAVRLNAAVRSRGRAFGRAAFVAALGVMAHAPSSAAAPSATVYEFYNVDLKHYFLTAEVAEANGIDNGSAGPGWKRTGGQFSAYKTAGEDGDAVPVCRFYGTPGIGPNSHFYTAVAEECAQVKLDPGWHYEGIAFHAPLPVGGACKAGTQKVYRAYNNGYVRNDSNHRYTVDLSVQNRMPKQGFSLEGTVMCAPLTDAEVEADIVRLLEQSTFGPTEALIAEVKQKGIQAWLDEQLALYETKFAERPPWGFGLSMAERVACITDNACSLANFSITTLQWEFFRQALTGRDQVRMRLAHALHQLLVLGTGGPSEVYAIRNFQQMIRDVALSTYEEALYRYAVSPQLGEFQGWAKNEPEHDGIKPNENFAREILQLLTTGIAKLNDDGTVQTAANGSALAAYTQADVTAMSKVLTGFTYPTYPGNQYYYRFNAPYHVGSMIPDDAFHDRSAKSLFNGSVQLAAGVGAEAEVRAAVKALVGQSSMAPFVVRQLIQRLVTSSPTPEYVRRVVDVFKDNGAGVRGDLKAVYRAILLDPEARGARKIDPEYGRLREPARYVAGIARALDIQSDGVWLDQLSYEQGMNIFGAPTIFSYFPADFRINNGTVPAAEFGLFGTASYIARANGTTRLVLGNAFGDFEKAPIAGWAPATGTQLPSMTAFLASTADPAAYVDRLNRLFFHGALSAASRTTMINAIAAVPASDAVTRARLGANLAAIAIDYQIQK